jgi:hypothetical protein
MFKINVSKLKVFRFCKDSVFYQLCKTFGKKNAMLT